MIDIESREHFDRVIESEKSVCVLFTADWCHDCVVIKPVMSELEAAFASSHDFVSIDRDPFMDLCGELNVLGIPSFIVFKAGKEVGRFVSRDRKTKDEIEDFLRRTETA